MANGDVSTTLTGRVQTGPSDLLREEILGPQLDADLDMLLPHFVAVERVLTAEYVRMGVLTAEQEVEICQALDSVDASALAAVRTTSMSDIAFALELHVAERLPKPVPAWHVDRSRNDYQACAQLLYHRWRVRRVGEAYVELSRQLQSVGERNVDQPMPGYTHLQAAQVISPGFYLAAINDQVLHASARLLATYDRLDLCPLGAGALSGQTLPWDRERIARALGFRASQPLAITAVASRRWIAEVTAELALFAVEMSRFLTDLMSFGSTAYGFIVLPDELSGISSAMPQKKNYPVLERIRGRLAHVSSLHTSTLNIQRNTAFSNSVEVSKEGGREAVQVFDHLDSALRLLTVVIGAMSFDAATMRAACEREYLGGFELANRLTLREGVPWRQAQVIAGRYIVLAMATGHAPSDVDPALLTDAAAEFGVTLPDAPEVLRDTFDVDVALTSTLTDGSANPASVLSALRSQTALAEENWDAWRLRSERAERG